MGTGDCSAGRRGGFTGKEEQPTGTYEDVIRKINAGC